VRAGPVGRDDVLGQLRRAVDQTMAGRGHLLLLAGEAGIGKTTLLTEASRYAESRGARVAWGWGWPGEGAPGYWPWVQVMRALGLDTALSATVLSGTGGSPEVDAAPASARFQLFDEVTSVLLAESRIQPLLVLLDDLQWADQPSQLLLDFLARRLPAGATAVVGAYRDVDPAPGPALAALAARTPVLPLTGLTVEAVTELIADVVGRERARDVAADVHRRTGGNPFFAQQVSWLLKGGREGVPPGVREALEQRFAVLPVGCTAALRAAAVAGPRFSADLVARAAGQPPGAMVGSLAEAVRARVLSQDGPGRYRFAHDLFREYAYHQLPAADRARLHQRLGVELEAERARGGDVSLAELARHFVQADPGSARAYRYCVAAAREATRRLAYEEAVHHWDEALTAAAGNDAQDARGAAMRIETLIELGEAQRRAGDGQAAGDAYLRAAGLARREQAGPESAARGFAAQEIAARGLAHAALGLHAIGTRMWWPPDQIVTLLSEALDALGDSDELLSLRVQASLARVLAWHRLDVPRAQALAEQAVAAARAAGDQPALIACLLAQHTAIVAPGTARARHAFATEVADLAGSTGDQEALLEAHLLAASDLLESADPAFRAELQNFLRLADGSQQPRFRYAGLVRRAMLAMLTGQLAEADRLVGQAAMLGEECGEPGAQDVHHDQGWELLTAQGRLGELADALPEMFPDPDSVPARGARAAVLLASGAQAEAARVIAPITDRDPAGEPPDNQTLLGAVYATELVAAFGAVPAAGKLYASLLPFAGQAVVSGVAISFKGAVAHHLGVLAATLGRAADAASHLERAIATHEQLGAVTWALRSRYQLAKLQLDDPDRRAAALATLTDVASEAHRIGMAQLARDAGQAAFAVGQAPVSSGVFTRDGALWTLSYGGQTVRIRDAKGLADLAVLLAAPGREVPAADLVAASGAGAAGRADLRLGADEVFDATARRQIRARVADLASEIAEAESWNDPERAARARTERDMLLRELAVAAGAGGGARLLGDQAERARKTVTARIRDVIGRIEQVHPALGAHLRASVTTGTRCTYSPQTPVTWQM
jgi:tetratricopeptide (TPR) repeat protein